jgi:hypothetical protein
LSWGILCLWIVLSRERRTNEFTRPRVIGGSTWLVQ